MIEEIRIRNLGVVEDATVVLSGGMTALTGETGAGKTMIVEAIRLLAGGKSDSKMARTGSAEAVIEARFVRRQDDVEVETVVSRVIPADGRGRAYVDGNMVSNSKLAEIVGGSVDLHGQLGFHSLFSSRAQRQALDRFGGTDTDALKAARHAVSEIESRISALAGDDGSREREIDLLRYQLDELDAAALDDPEESDVLKAQEAQLADVNSLREAGEAARSALDSASGGALQAVGAAIAALRDKAPFAEVVGVLETVSAQVNESNLDIAAITSGIVDDPERLAEVQQRRQQLRSIERKYGPTLNDAMNFASNARHRLSELTGHDAALAKLDDELANALKKLEKVEASTAKHRKSVAPKLSAAVEERLTALALKGARFGISVEGPAGDDVTFLLGANAGMDMAPLAKAASGGELARTMLALRLSLTEAQATDVGDPPTMVFDEVDAGVGGEAAVAVGRALGELGHDKTHQVLVVTHLPQVAAFADHQLHVSKGTKAGKTVSDVVEVTGEAREIELTRMLAGRPDSKAGREHARELLNARNPQPKQKARSGTSR